jgi:hypothetical protein
MGLAQAAEIADRPASATARRSAEEVEAGIAAWLSIVGDRNSRLHKILRGASETEAEFDPFSLEVMEADHALLRRLLTGLMRLPA